MASEDDTLTPSEQTPDVDDTDDSPAPSTSTDPRQAKLAALRKRMAESAQANRRELINESNAVRSAARNTAKLERKRKQLEAMGEKMEARETGEDLERKKNWEYSIEDNERWDKKKERKGRRADFSFTDYDDIARRKYKKDMDIFKPDLASYNAQRSAAESTSQALTAGTSSAAAEDLYRDADSFVYADHKPSEDAIDRVIGKINLDKDKRQKRSRERDEDEGDITYINEQKNRMFNKKLERYYHSHTKEIRDNFERGTAL
ncbi:pre-mRNA-splicing factor SYF2 [Pseudohyphozyma bogoriensis]|nr:pre-mRNA-splicing factor SYF2 [Pseudohyphozyma bogoriensis]